MRSTARFSSSSAARLAAWMISWTDFERGADDQCGGCREAFSRATATIGIEVSGIELKDVILPGEMREILNQVVAAAEAGRSERRPAAVRKRTPRRLLPQHGEGHGRKPGHVAPEGA